MATKAFSLYSKSRSTLTSMSAMRYSNMSMFRRSIYNFDTARGRNKKDKELLTTKELIKDAQKSTETHK